MKILYVVLDAGIPVGGVKGASAHVRALAKAFVETGHDITIIACNTGGSEHLPAGVHLVHFSPGNATEVLSSVCAEAQTELHNLFYNIDAYCALTELIRDELPDVVIERLSLFSLAAFVASRGARVPYLLEVNAPLADEASNYRGLLLHETARLLERAVVCGADIVLPVSSALRDWAVGLGAAHERVHVMANGVDTKLFDPSKAKDKRKELGLEGAHVMGFVGSLRPWHGVDLLLEAFGIIAAHDRKACLLIVGDGPARENIERWCEKSNLSDRVLLTGSVPQTEVPDFLATMDVVLVPYEKLQNFYFSPLKILESLAMGRPTVAASIGDIPKLITHGRTGLLVPPGNAQELAAAAESLLREPDLAANLGAAARAGIVRDHDWLCVARRIMELTRVTGKVLR